MKKEVGEILKKVGEGILNNKTISYIEKRNSILCKASKPELSIAEIEKKIIELSENPKDKDLLLEAAELIVYTIHLLDLENVEGAADANS